MRGLLNQALGFTPTALQARVRQAADAGDPAARLVLGAMREANVRAGRPEDHPGLSPKLILAWRCPKCSAKAASARGLDDSIVCTAGHRSPVAGQVWAQKFAGLRNELKTGRVAAKPAPVKAKAAKASSALLLALAEEEERSPRTLKASTSRLLRQPKR